jgi:hypothetical protein
MSTFAYPPNWDGLRRLLQETSDVFEALDVRLIVAGVGASPEQIAVLKQYSFVDYVGFVTDLDTVFRKSRAGIVPVWAGAGVKLKTITMMSRGLPVLSTTAGMEGVPENSALCVSESPRALVEEAMRRSPEELRMASARAFEMVAQHFSEDAFESSVKSATASLVQRSV